MKNITSKHDLKGAGFRCVGTGIIFGDGVWEFGNPAREPAHESTLAERIDQLAMRMDSLERQIEPQEAVDREWVDWREEINRSIADLHLSVTHLELIIRKGSSYES